MRMGEGTGGARIASTAGAGHGVLLCTYRAGHGESSECHNEELGDSADDGVEHGVD